MFKTLYFKIRIRS